MNKITVTTNKKASMSDFYGIFFEDINHAADGGLYGEMIRNRAFEFQSEIRIILFLKLTKQAQEPA